MENKIFACRVEEAESISCESAGLALADRPDQDQTLLSLSVNSSLPEPKHAGSYSDYYTLELVRRFAFSILEHLT
jgi:hypothetical protein